ncbi:MAG: hypothetical protein KDD36_13675 [Flavobacteriales bacterium]|nr:hypothetical protein [Flavobacteriales bacterium]
MSEINLRKQRDFGESLGAAFEFIRQNFLKLLKPILVFSGIPMLLGGLLISTWFSDVMTMSMQAQQPGANAVPPNPFTFLSGMLGGYFFVLLGALLFFLTVNSYIKLYAEGGDTGLGSIMQEIKKNFLRYFGGFIVMGVMVMVGAMLCIIPGIYVAVTFSLVFVVMSVEGIGPFAAMSRSASLIKENWWATFGLFIVAYMIQAMITYIFALPMYVGQFAMIFSGIEPGASDPAQAMETMQNAMGIMTWYMPIYMLGASLANLILLSVTAIRYYSLVETKEGTGDLDKIESLGEQGA